METFTNIVNYTALAMAVWLGIYLVTRSSRSRISWLSSLTLWSMAGVFLNSLLALNPPPSTVAWPAWLHLFLPFWSANALQAGWTEWLRGWLVIPAVAFWHNATLLMLPGKLSAWRWARLLFVYAVAFTGILALVYTPLIVQRVGGDPTRLGSLIPGSLFSVFLGFLVIFTAFCLFNLVQSAGIASSPAARNQIVILIIATTLAGLTSLAAMISFAFFLNLPTVLLSILLGCAVFLTGFGVARYSALSQGRTMRTDFLYNATAIALVTAVYMSITWFSVQLYMVPPIAFVFVLILAIVSHSLVDFARRSLDLLFFRKNARELRANLREISRLVGEKTPHTDNYGQMVGSICDSIKAAFGLLVLFDGQVARLAASCGWQGSDFQLEPSELCSDDIRQLEPGHFSEPLSEVALLVPLYGDGSQIGAVLVGKPENGIDYSEADIDLLYYPCDQLAYFILQNRHREEYIKEIEHLALSSPIVPQAGSDYVDTNEVETCLRNLYDYAYLGASPLSRLASIQAFMPAGNVTHLDRGKAVHSLLLQGIEKLRPEEKDPCGQPPREWYFYLILRFAYVEDKSNREIMSQLYISEGTFNRTRRSAVRAVTRALNEMEAVIN